MKALWAGNVPGIYGHEGQTVKQSSGEIAGRRDLDNGEGSGEPAGEAGLSRQAKGGGGY